MSRCAKCGKSNGIPSNIPLKDMRTGTKQSVKTDADLVGKKPYLDDKRGMNQSKLNVRNPLGKN